MKIKIFEGLGNVLYHMILWNTICDFQVHAEMNVKITFVYCADYWKLKYF